MSGYRNSDHRSGDRRDHRSGDHRTQGNRPIDHLKKGLDDQILIRIKANRLFRAMLRGYDEHLNLLVDDAVQIYNVENEDGNIVEERENLGRIIIRGDNVVFIEFSEKR
ncbi:MAG: LSM domain-containing protein [Promethearchaeota archaeon]